MARKKKIKQEPALDLVDQLLANEKPVAPKKRGRPKGSKNKTKKPKPKVTVKDTALELVDTLIANEDKPKKKKTKEIYRAKFVTSEEYEELGCPKWGFTTARIKQWTNRTTGYFEILLEYQRAAIQWAKLTRTIGWYIKVDEGELNLCRKEIKHFCEQHGLTKGDLSEVIQFSYNHQHKRKRMLKVLKETAKIVLEDRRKKAETEEEKKAINFREVIKIPQNVKPILKYVKLELSSIEDDVRGAIADLTGSQAVISEHACPDHITYRGLRKPRNHCPTCLYFYKWNKKQGVKETRNR